MSTLIFTGRLGRDGELRYTPGGEAVINLAVAYNYGRKGQDDKRPTQWVDCALFGKRAEALAPYLLKGQQLYLILRDVHIRTYQKNDNTQGFTLSGSVAEIELIGGRQEGAAPAQQPSQRPASPAAQNYAAASTGQSAPAGGFDAFDDDLPFMRLHYLG